MGSSSTLIKFFTYLITQGWHPRRSPSIWCHSVTDNRILAVITYPPALVSDNFSTLILFLRTVLTLSRPLRLPTQTLEAFVSTTDVAE